ncbi:MAG: hypothetical protein FWK04_30635 [Nostoc sp. GBBB01]|jgi:hypothetical protein|uniref:Transposase n=1 Tax=Nostoc punctiforme FACHB-252 TaxID=1357509 RepID=A0ABR8H6I3_NOSPU|nr:hypothetical protein [Nostoc punctiforme]MBD2611432.1 hypothetical protein [Nostoc punctiforme FACHB-252]MBL1203306.1 hypothetical protein [Nostoc sp. GBBB01]
MSVPLCKRKTKIVENSVRLMLLMLKKYLPLAKAKTLGQSQVFERRRVAACPRLPQSTQKTQRTGRKA